MDNFQEQKTVPYEEGFLALLLMLAMAGLLWLFWPFIPGLLLSALLAAATFPIFNKLRQRVRFSRNQAALTMTMGVLLLVVTPVLYLLVATATRMAHSVDELRRQIGQLQAQGGLDAAIQHWINLFPFEYGREMALSQIASHKTELGELAAKTTLFLFKGISGNSLAFFSALMLIVFSLFFFYRDGPNIVQRIKNLTPLANNFDDFILNRFQSLSTVLILSTGAISLIQGGSFALVTAFMGLHWFYLGVAVAVASFIPVVGGLIIWAPLSYLLFLEDRTMAALVVVIWGGVVNGFLVDNLVRPLIIQELSKLFSSGENGADLGVLNHTLMTVLATLGGVIAFGILGLFFGPLIAAMAITIFDVYEIIHGHELDHD